MASCVPDADYASLNDAAFLLQVSQGTVAGTGVALVGNGILDLLEIKLKKKKKRLLSNLCRCPAHPCWKCASCSVGHGKEAVFQSCRACVVVFHWQRSSRSMCRRGAGAQEKGPMSSARTGRHWKARTLLCSPELKGGQRAGRLLNDSGGRGGCLHVYILVIQARECLLICIRCKLMLILFGSLRCC